MPTGARVDPFGNFNFKLEISGITRAAFHEASGFDSTIDVTEHREGGENTTVRKLPAMTKLIELQVKPSAEEGEVYAMQDLQEKTRVLSARWEEFYRTMDAVVRHSAWAP